MSTSVLEIDKSPVLEDVHDLNQLSLSLGGGESILSAFGEGGWCISCFGECKKRYLLFWMI